MKTKPLILVDGSSYLFRAYYALPPLTNSKGQPTGAIYGVINMLKKLISEYDPDYLAVVFDSKGKTFRHELYSEYKANRLVMPDDLAAQIKPLHELIEALGFPLVVETGVEADDVIGTLAKQAVKKGLPVLISTGDKDMAQLVDKNVTLVNTMTNTVLDQKGVKEKFGVSPEHIIDYLALMGDTSDNVPGVPKVGPKTAAKWLNEFGTLDHLIQKADQVKGKVGENLRAFIPDFPRTVELVTIKTDVKLAHTIPSLKRQKPDYPKLKKMFSELEFRKWLEQIETAPDETAAVVSPTSGYETILDEAAWKRWHEKLKAASLFAFDTETTSLDPMEAELVGVSFAIKKGEAAYVPLAHDYAGAPKQLDKATFLNSLASLLQEKSKSIVGQNLKYDMEVLRHEGIEIKTVLYDTLLESYVINATAARHNLDALAEKYLDKKTITFEEVAGKGVKQLTFNQIPLEKAAPYAAEDADLALQLHNTLYPEIESLPAYKTVFHEIEMPLMPVLARMEYYGVLIDAKKLAQQSASLEKEIKQLEKKAHELAGETFNLSSTKQLQEILYEKMQIPVIKKTPGGQPSTAELVLQDLSHHHELPAVILQYRSLAKLKSTYTDKLPEQISPRDGRVHTSYNQAVTSTGRLSSNNPNLQNIPVRTKEGRRIREAFVAPAGYKMAALDYSQVELRIVAHLSKDPGLLNAFQQGQDVHASTAAEVFGVPIEKVTPNQRRSAKAINFGLLYGMSAFGLSRQLGIGRKEAQEHMDVYFKKYPKVHAYMEHARETARKNGYVETMMGRRLYIPAIHSKNKMQQIAAERAAINAPMQGTAAEIIKIAMIRVDEWIQKENIDAKMVMQVHDELIFEVNAKHATQIVDRIRHFMEQAAELSIPLVVDVGLGDNWGAAH